MNTRFDAGPQLTQKNSFYTFATIKVSSILYPYTLQARTSIIRGPCSRSELSRPKSKGNSRKSSLITAKSGHQKLENKQEFQSPVRKTTEKTALRFLGAKQADIGTIFDVICLTSINIEQHIHSVWLNKDQRSKNWDTSYIC